MLQGWRAQRAEPDGLVFPGRNGDRLDNVRKAWLAVLADAKIKGFSGTISGTTSRAGSSWRASISTPCASCWVMRPTR